MRNAYSIMFNMIVVHFLGACFELIFISKTLVLVYSPGFEFDCIDSSQINVDKKVELCRSTNS